MMLPIHVDTFINSVHNHLIKNESVGRPIGVEIEIVVYFLCESVAYSQGTRRNDPDFDSEKNSIWINCHRVSR